ncbi:DUF4097 domain-containing protein [Radiobacillus kanasensis]|uniref:DUF4097 family beta strand repeat-containing protein n=1 Tax=Radiobacillus kanasensis TaxID=2844358 RepID=UPI001E2EAFF0|nr:DUF4097 domain-containing protein [Radiobacillus kanasensis]UFT98513.1 DUF4097 domain-containing protein [Radiobacillus kanasensis]
MNEERKRILAMLDDGLISVEEAEELFDTLKEAESKQTNALTTKVDWESEGHKKQYANQARHTSKKILHFLEDAVQKIKDVDLDFNFGTAYPVSHIFYMDAVAFEDIRIGIANGHVQLSAWNEPNVRVECEAKVYQVQNQSEARQKFLRETQFEIENNRLQLESTSKQVKTNVVVKVPNRLFQSLDIRLFNGDVNIGYLEVVNGTIKTSNGTIHIENGSAEDWKMETGNGPIQLIHSNGKRVDVETINGAIKLEGYFQQVHAQSVSGSIECVYNGEEAQSGHFKSTTGNLRIYLAESKRIDGKLTTKLGKIRCKLKQADIIEDKQDVMNKLLRFEVLEQEENPLFIEGDTKTGSIWVIPKDEEEIM